MKSLRLSRLRIGSFGEKKKKTSKSKQSFSELYVLSDIILGKGSYATVKKGFNKKTGELVAVKIVDKSDITQSDLRKIRREIQALECLSHENIVNLYDHFETKSEFILVMEYLGGGELYEKIVDDKYIFSEDEIRDIIFQIASALKYCNDKGIAHRDIKPNNLVYTNDGKTLKLIDFNLSFDELHKNIRPMETVCGTRMYVAPEVAANKKYDASCDYWSLGVIVYLMASNGYLPYEAENDKALMRQVAKGEYELLPKEAWENVSSGLIDLLKSLMDKNPIRRSGYEDIIRHPWMKAGGFIEMKTLQRLEQKAKDERIVSSLDKLQSTCNVFNIAHALGDLMELSYQQESVSVM